MFTVSAAVASIQVSNASPIPPDTYCERRTLSQEHIYTKKPTTNILKQAWLDSQSLDAWSSVDSDCGQTAEQVTSSSDITSSCEFAANRGKTKRPRVKPGLPKPKIYKPCVDDKKKMQQSKKRKLQLKELDNDSSDDDDDDGSRFISKLEKEIYSKPRSLLQNDTIEDMLTTSTPTRTQQVSHSDLPSPIHSLTPLRNSSLFGGSFLNTLDDHKCLSLSPELKKNEDISPNDSFLVFNMLPFVSPDKIHCSPSHDESLSNQNLSRFLSEYGLDAANDIPEEFPNLNWNAMAQIVDNMDTS